jgi:hypothetical protein
VAKKRPQQSATRKGSSKPPKAAQRPAGKSARKSTAKVKATAPPKRGVATARPAGPTLGEQAEHLRDEIQRSKLTHPDPWTYTVKARAWGERAQALVEQIDVNGDTPATRRTLDALVKELQGDRDFQEARRLF